MRPSLLLLRAVSPSLSFSFPSSFSTNFARRTFSSSTSTFQSPLSSSPPSPSPFLHSPSPSPTPTVSSPSPSPSSVSYSTSPIPPNDLELFSTPLTHFGRKTRILLHELNIPFKLTRPSSVLTDDFKQLTDEENQNNKNNFASNPLLKVPTLRIKIHSSTSPSIFSSQFIFDSDHIARYIAEKYDTQNKYHVVPQDIPTMNSLSVLDGIMSNEVPLLLSKRSGISEEVLQSATYFKKMRKSIHSGLQWLEDQEKERQKMNEKERDFHWVDMVMVSMWDHVLFNDLCVDMKKNYPLLARNVEKYYLRESVIRTSPSVSLEEAKKEGWTSGA